MSRVIVLHTTETGKGTTRSVATYLLRNNIASHEVFDPATGELYQLLGDDSPGKALVNEPGGVETNRRDVDNNGPDVYQIEIVGFAEQVPTYPDQWFKSLAAHLRNVAKRIGAPLVFPVQFLKYPQSYGQSPVRLSYDDWNAISGIVGHMHVPENSHGDPGDISRVIPFTLNQTPQQQPNRKAPPTMICIHDTSDNTVYLWNGSKLTSFGGHPLLYQLHVNAGVPTVQVESIVPIRAALGV